MSALFNIIVPVFLIVGFGYLVAWHGIFRESAVDGLMVFAQNFAAPTLLFASMSTSPSFFSLFAVTSSPSFAVPL